MTTTIINKAIETAKQRIAQLCYGTCGIMTFDGEVEEIGKGYAVQISGWADVINDYFYHTSKPSLKDIEFGSTQVDINILDAEDNVVYTQKIDIL